jgi:hypothetical protein
LRWKRDATHPNFLLGHWRHTYIEIDQPSGEKDTWGVLGVGTKGDNQEVVKDQLADDRDPLDGGPIGEGIPVPSSDEQAEHLKNMLDATVYPGSKCPSCGTPYHNSALNGGFKPSVHNPFTFFNSNTYTFNMITNGNLAPPPISNAPGYFLNSAYSGYPY